ncbi:MAG TPA: ATP-binding protein, partial [Humibacter sp.]|nr:ATP-binding protein [Humibacter sp.]
GDVITDLLLAAAPPAEQEPRQVIEVVEVVEQTLADLRMLAARRDIALEFTSHGRPTTAVPATSLRRCVVALVDNAIGHSPDGGVVEVIVGPGRDRAQFVLSVKDHGSGITGIDPGRLFERFAHGDDATVGPARTGFGIGLALVRDLADRYGGRIEVADTSSAGTTFTLSLPRS